MPLQPYKELLDLHVKVCNEFYQKVFDTNAQILQEAFKSAIDLDGGLCSPVAVELQNPEPTSESFPLVLTSLKSFLRTALSDLGYPVKNVSLSSVLSGFPLSLRIDFHPKEEPPMPTPACTLVEKSKVSKDVWADWLCAIDGYTSVYRSKSEMNTTVSIGTDNFHVVMLNDSGYFQMQVTCIERDRTINTLKMDTSQRAHMWEGLLSVLIDLLL